MTPIDTADLERLLDAAARHRTNVAQFLEAVCDRGHVTQDEFDAAHSDDEFAQDELRSMAEALAFEVLAHRKAEAGMRALLRAGCDLLAIESEALRNSIRIVGNPDRLSDAPEDAHAVEAIREMEDWIASVKATLYPTTPEAEGGRNERA